MRSASEKMFTVAAASFALVSAVALTGCRSEVMNDRPYQPLDKTQAQPAAVDPVPVEELQPVKGKGSSQYQPMETPAVKPAAKSSASKASVAPGSYTVKKGDTMSGIAARSGVKLGALLAANNMDMKSAGRIRIGQKIVIPGGNAVKAGRAVKSSGKAAKAAAGTKAAKSTAAAKEIPAGLLNADGTYTVKRGDSIPRIARKLGVKASALQQANNLSDEATRHLQIGQKLAVPGKGAVVTTGSAPTVKPAPTDADVSKLIEGAESTPAPAPAPAATQAAAPAPAATATAAPAAANLDSARFTTVEADTTVEELAKANNITVDQFLQLNAECKAGEKLEKGRYVFLPKK